MTTVVSIMMSDIVPLRERGVWQGIMNIIYAAGAGCGAPLGTQSATCEIMELLTVPRWHPSRPDLMEMVRFFFQYPTEEFKLMDIRAFIGQAPLCAIAFASVALILHLPKTDSSGWKTKIRRVDFLGALVMVCAVFALLLGLDRGSNVSWSSPLTIASLVVSLPLFSLFVLVEEKLAAEPFAPGRIIFERSLFACYLCNFFSFGGWLSMLFYLPLFYQAVNGFSASQAGVRLFPGIVAGVSGSLFAGILMKRTGKYYWLTVSAYSLLALGK